MQEEVLIIVVVSIVTTFGFLTALVMTYHQRKMAELIHRREAQNNDVAPLVNEVVRLREQVEHLNHKVNQQTIELDEVKSRGSGHAIPERLSQEKV